MITGSRVARAILFGGDLAVFAFSLWVTLGLRYLALPTPELFLSLVGPFAVLFVLWIFVFLLAGLYDKRTLIVRRTLPERLVRVQATNIILAALFFFLVPGLGVAPKTILVIYLAISLVLILSWRLAVFPRLLKRRWRQRAVIIGVGDDVRELAQELNTHERYAISCYTELDPSVCTPETLPAKLDVFEKEDVGVVVVDVQDPAVTSLLPALYTAVFEKHRFDFLPLAAVYEDVFERVPLSLLRYDWVFAHAVRRDSFVYVALKRAMDIVGGFIMGVVTLIALPFVWLAMRLEGSGELFITQERFGRYGRQIRVYKFRTMTQHVAASGQWANEGTNRVTRVGAFLRKTSLDEFPQFVNVLRGDLSLIGPRNDILGLGERLAEALPYYMTRYLVTPGISGWAQVNQQYEQGNISPQSVAETRLRLAYDFYYLKYRSFMLDIAITLKTAKRMFFRVSSR